jgi:hypothetical protein
MWILRNILLGSSLSMNLEEVPSITDDVLPQLLRLGAPCCNGSA